MDVQCAEVTDHGMKKIKSCLDIRAAELMARNVEYRPRVNSKLWVGILWALGIDTGLASLAWIAWELWRAVK